MCDLCHITPCNDVAFKIIFTAPGHERILIHFLNCAIKSSTPIKKVTLLDREITPEQIEEKGSRLDILAETENGEKIDVEMQVGREEFMLKRSLFYWARNYTSGFKKGQPYGDLKRTVCINILDFNLFDDDEFWGINGLYDFRREKTMSRDLEIQFIELNKVKRFDKDSPITFWVEFFKDPRSEASQKLYTLVPELEEAKEVFDFAITDEGTRKKILMREDANRNYNSAIAGAEYKAKLETAKNALSMGLSIEQTAKLTGLSTKEVEALNSKTRRA